MARYAAEMLYKCHENIESHILPTIGGFNSTLQAVYQLRGDHPWSRDVLIDEGISTELSEVATGMKPRRIDDGVAVFDSIRLAIQDVAAAQVVYERNTEQDGNTRVR